MVKFILLLACTLCSIQGLAQSGSVRIECGGENFTLQYSDSAEIQRLKRDWVASQRALGHLEAGIDSCTYSSDTLVCRGHLGPRYAQLLLDSHNLPTAFLAGDILDLQLSELDRVQRQLITNYENRGYPFASLRLMHARSEDGRIRASLFFDPGMHIRYDSLLINGSSTLSTTFLASYLNLQPGADYREKDVKDIDRKLRNLPLVKLRRATRVQFYDGFVRIELSIDPQVTDRLDGVLGLAPGSEASGQQFLITGELNLELNNLFDRAGSLQLHWRNYLQRSQLLDIEASWPYLFGSRFGVNGRLDLNKYDSLFVNVRTQFGLRYQRLANDYVELYYALEQSSLLSVDTLMVRQQKRLPSNNPYRVNQYGFKIHRERIDYRPNPRSGFEIDADLSLGVKELVRNTLVDRVRFVSPQYPEGRSIYDTIKAQSLRGRLAFDLRWFVPIGRNSTLLNRLRSNALVANSILLNEYMQLGGFNSLQGFDENAFLTNAFAIYRLEYRYLFSTNGHLGAFVNAAYVDQAETGEGQWPVGFGLSTRLQTGNSILQIAYALGRTPDQPISLRSGKIHFGLLNYF